MDAFTASLDRLAGIVGSAYVSLQDNGKHEADWRGRYHGKTLAVVRPRDTQAVSAVVSLCREAGLSIVPQGGNTGMSGGSIPPAGTPNVVLCLDRLNAIRALDATGNTVVAEAGCTLAALQEAAEAAGRLFPLSLGSEGSCQIGGNISTNAGGTAVLRFGNMRELVLGLEVVLPDGAVWNGLRALRKDNTGYDLKQLFIGAEGTLGIITAASLKLFPARTAMATGWTVLDRLEDALALLSLMQDRHGDRLTTFEVMSRTQLDLVLDRIPGTRAPLSGAHAWHALVEVTDGRDREALERGMAESLEAAMAAGIIADGSVAASLGQREAFWRLRESVSEANRSMGYSVSHDTSVPISRVPAFVHAATAVLEARPSKPRVVSVGHVGDGNIHVVAIFPREGHTAAQLAEEAEAASAEVHRIAVQMDGSISAEHGIGSAKREELALYKPPVEMQMMRRLKQVFDPSNIMNPGKIL
jgi:FAD/FMN-containing dehydrogenase